MFHNANAGDVTKWTLRPADAEQLIRAKSDGNGPLQPDLRLTFQVSPRNKLNLFWDEQISNDSIGAGSCDDRAGNRRHGTTGSSACSRRSGRRRTTNKLLLEAGIGTYLSNWNTRERPDNDRARCIADRPNSARCAALRSQRQASPACVSRGMNSWSARLDRRAHLERRGVVRHRRQHHEVRLPGRLPRGQSVRQAATRTLTYRVNNGVPEPADPDRIDYDEPHSRVRYNAALRAGSVDARTADDAGRHPLRPFVELLSRAVDRRREVPADARPPFPETKGVDRHTTTSRRAMGVAYDLFGNGKTALKFNMGSYLEAAVNGNGNYSALLPCPACPLTASHRPWTDRQRQLHTRTATCRTCTGAGSGRRTGTSAAQISERWRSERSRSHVVYDPNDHAGLGRPAGDWQIGVDASSTRSCRACRSKSATRGAWLRTFTVTDNRAHGRGGLRRRPASPRRSIRGAAGRRRLPRSLPGSSTPNQARRRADRQLLYRTCARRTTGTEVFDLQRPGVERERAHAYTACSCRRARARDRG